MGLGLHLVGGFSQGGFCRDRWPLRGPICEGRCPSALPLSGRSALHPGRVYAELAAPTPHYAGAPPCTRVTFPSRGKSPKARQGLRPLEPAGAKSPPFSRSLTHRAGLVSATDADGFATLRWWGKLDCAVSLGFEQEKYSAFNPWRGSIAGAMRLHVWMQLWGRFGV